MKKQKELLLAAHNGRDQLFFLLLRLYPALTTQKHLAAKAIICAANAGHLVLTKAIVKYFNTDINKIYPNGKTILSSMKRKGTETGVQTLLAAKADPNVTPVCPKTP